jgi:hypothetical protein
VRTPFDVTQFPLALGRRIASAIHGLEELLELVEYGFERRVDGSKP